MKTIKSVFELGDSSLFYVTDEERTGMIILPKGMTPVLDGTHRNIDSLVQVKLTGDKYSGKFANGFSMHNSGSTVAFRYDSQEKTELSDRVIIKTVLKSDTLTAVHELSYLKRCDIFESEVTIQNVSNDQVGIEMLSSFSLGMLSPLDSSYKPGKINIHRFRCRWSIEAHHEVFRAEDLLLYPQACMNDDIRTEKIGSVGCKTTGSYFPYIGIEDTENGVIWGAQLQIDGSWQMEIFNTDETLCLAGGLADYDFGHWMKNLEPGESFTSPKANLAVCKGDIDDLADKMISWCDDAFDRFPEQEKELPVMFNEWCASWGAPSRENVFRMLDAVKNRGITYFVMDAGWYKDAEHAWFEKTGDWIPSKEKYPNGIKEVADKIREAGMIPGLWCEAETCGILSEAFNMKEHLLTKFGKQIVSRVRKYFDYRDPWVIDYMNTRIVDLLDEAEFGYLKMDSNENCGIGCDGAESFGEGLRQHLEGYDNFVKNMQKRLPNLVVENCSSGGMRVTPKMCAQYPIYSGSDAFESESGPMVFANMQWIAPARQNLVWCTVRESESSTKLRFKLAAGFLGRMCISGDVVELNDEKQKILDEAIACYKKAVPVIRSGKSHRQGSEFVSYTTPMGWQAVIRNGKETDETLVVLHTFGGELADKIEINIPEGLKEIKWSFASDEISSEIIDGKLVVSGLGNKEGAVFMIGKR